ncbi:GDP-mannose 4,6-dehydratase [soil metagenome]
MSRALVTGAAGFVGSTLVDRLLADGHQVLGIDNLSTGRIGNLEQAFRLNRSRPGRFHFLEVDVQAPELKDIVGGTNPDTIFHLAAQIDVRVSVADPQFDARSNVLGTINLCEAARLAGVHRIVYAASGGSRYGAPTCLPVGEDSMVDPLSPYAVAKIAGELYLRAYAGMYGMAPICLALSNVYGPRQNPHGEAGVIALFCAAMATGAAVTVYGDGTATRDYVYVDDVVNAFICAGRAPHSVTGLYNVGTGKQTSVLEVHRMVAAMFDGAPPPSYAPARTGELDAIALDAGKAAAELGWVPTVELAEGVARTVDWIRDALEPGPTAVGAFSGTPEEGNVR